MERADRIGAWVSGVAHAALIAWVAVGGALFRGQSSAPIRMTNVQTMTEADFQQMAAATRGAGPVGETAQVQPAQPQAPGDEVVASRTRSYCQKSVSAWLNYPARFDFNYTHFHEAEWEAGNRRSVCWAQTEE